MDDAIDALGDDVALGMKGEDTCEIVLRVFISRGCTDSCSFLERFGEAWRSVTSVKSLSENLRFEPGVL